MLLHIHGFNSSPASNTFYMLREVFPQARALAYACHALFADNLAALHAQAVALYQEALDKQELAGQELAGQGLRGQQLAQECAASAKDGGTAARTSLPPLPALVISGSSLGGFYASQLAARLHAEYPQIPCHCALFNPVVYPAAALRPFLGRNTLMHSGEEWEFTPAMLESYAHFPDTRAHLSCHEHSEANSTAHCQISSDAIGDSHRDNCSDNSKVNFPHNSHDNASDPTCARACATRKDSPQGMPPFPLRRFVLLGRNDSLLNPEEARHYWQHCAQIHYTDDEHSLAALDAVTVAALRDLGAGE